MTQVQPPTNITEPSSEAVPAKAPRGEATESQQPQRQAMIRVQEATKRYGSTLAADRVSFAIHRNEVVGFLGPNGAGKSTVLKMISTWLPPTSGTVEVAGFDVQRDPLAVRRVLGYLPEHNAMYDTMRVDRFIRFMGRIRGLGGSTLRDRMEWVIAKCTLSAVLAKRINQCSKGYRQRIGLAAALLHDPQVILLDEPTHGLDPLQVVAFRDFISKLAADRAILFSSHILAEVMAVCERLLIINHGRLLEDATVEELTERGKSEGKTLEEVVLDVVKRGGSRQ